jgi:transcriptional regulator with XRE-family HTH domain
MEIASATASALHHRIAARVRELRAARGYSLDELATRSGVSRSMLSLIERGESSPTAVVLDRVASGLGVMLPSLFDGTDGVREVPKGPLARREDQPEWEDPGSGYRRRIVSPTGMSEPVQIIEVEFPAGQRVAFENGARGVRVYQQIWMLEGTMEVTFGGERHRLRTGDCLATHLDRPIVFHNPTRRRARYAVVIASEPSATR